MALHNNKIKLSSGPHNYDTMRRTHLLNYAQRWCKEHFGVNGRKKYAISYTCYSDDTDTYIGYYNDKTNTICMNLYYIKSMRELLATYIHEYQHSLQPTRSRYWKLAKRFGYLDHPYEVHARSHERYYRHVMNDYRVRYPDR